MTLRALEDNPELAADVPDAQVKRLKAEAAKERGNDAFKAKDYSVALEHYSEAIKADNTNSTYYSNRCVPHAILHVPHPTVHSSISFGEAHWHVERRNRWVCVACLSAFHILLQALHLHSGLL